MQRLSAFVVFLTLAMPTATAAPPPDFDAHFVLENITALRGFKPGRMGSIGPGRLRPAAATAAMDSTGYHGPTELRYYVFLFPTAEAASQWATEYARRCSAPVRFARPNAAGVVVPRALSHYWTDEDIRAAKRRLGAKAGDMREVWKTARGSILHMEANAVVGRLVVMVLGVQNREMVRLYPELARERLSDAALTRTVRAAARELILRARRYPDNR